MNARSGDSRRPPTLLELVQAFESAGDRPALVHLDKGGARRLSYGNLFSEIETRAAGLMGRLDRGDNVALLGAAGPDWVIGCLAVVRAGAVAVPLDPQLNDRALAHVLADAAPALILLDGDQRHRLEKLGWNETQLVLLDAMEPGSGRMISDTVSADDPAVLFYTSGTTGPPKGVPLLHRNLVFQLGAVRQARIVGPGDRVLLPLPLHHVYPFVLGLLSPLEHGLPVIFPRSLTGPELARAMREERASVIIGVPRLYSALVSGIGARIQTTGRAALLVFHVAMVLSAALRRRFGWRIGRRLFAPLHQHLAPDLRIAACGGAALPPELAWKLEGLGWQVLEGYGLTETAPLIALNRPGHVRVGSVGQPVPGIDVRLGKTSAAPEEGGEIQVRGPGVFPGYRHLEDATSEAFTADGWFRTGDLGRLDDDGYLYVLGRASTLIVTESGENIQPEEVEKAYEADRFIREVGVFAREGRLLAVVVPDVAEVRRRGGDERELVREAVQRRAKVVASYMRLSDYVVARRPLARTRLGKLRRHLLSERFDEVRRAGGKPPTHGPISPEEMSDEDQALLEHGAARQVWEWLARSYPKRHLTPDTSPALDLGVDSMEWLNLTLEIGQRTGVDLGDEAIARIETVRDLLREVSEASEGAGANLEAALSEPDRFLSDSQRRWLRPLGPLGDRTARLLYHANRRLMRLLFRLESARAPSAGQMILAPLHVSYLDPFAIAAALDRSFLPRTYWGGWRGVAFTNPLVRFGSRLTRVIPVDPESGVFASLALAAAVLKRGDSLVWFPEGGRSPDGRLQEFRPGIGLLLQYYPVPVVPVALVGTYEAWPVSRRLPRLRPLRVHFGEPLDPQMLEHDGVGEDAARRITEALRRRTASLADDARRLGHQGNSEPS